VLSDQHLVAFVATADPSRARAFYEGILGLTLVEDAPIALVFDANGTWLRVAKVGQVTPATYTVLGWKVADIVAQVSELVARGVSFERYAGIAQDALGIWSTDDGDRVAWFRDPDGNVLSLTEIAQ
jgi:catechol 2,3-dioxygenase-like lactoylglutathione lyase family enzyme